MMLRFPIIAVVIILLAVWDATQAAEKRSAQSLAPEIDGRVALVIGNSSYTYANRLANPKNDAGDIAALLRRLNFDVIEAVDLNQSEMVDRIQAFAEKAESAKTALFYYAGHGLQVDGHNYLLATDAKLEKKALLKYQAIDLDDITSVMAGDGRIAIVLLDACRDNPLSRSYQVALGANRSASVKRGLAYPDSAADGLLIGFATSPGVTAADGQGRNSPYAAALLKYLEEPGTHIEQTLKKVSRDVSEATKGQQRPWYNSSLSDDFIINYRSSHEPKATESELPPGSEASLEEESQPRKAEVSAANDLEISLRAFGHLSKQEFALAIADADQAIQLNQNSLSALVVHCWSHAAVARESAPTLELLGALSSCNSVLRKWPDAPPSRFMYQSRALIHLKLGKLRAAIEDYDASLRYGANSSIALYGRGEAKFKIGDLKGAQADKAAATTIEAGVAERFEKVGIDLP